MLRPKRTYLIGSFAAILVFGTSCASDTPSTTPPPTPSPSASASPSALPDDELISILSPSDGATVSVPITAGGTANTFEAALTLDVMNEAGDVLCIKRIMATSGSGTPGTWETVLGFGPEREDTDSPITLRAYEISPKDGSAINVVERRLILSPERPAIMLTSPVCGDTVAAGGVFAVQGLATVFEAALTIELRDASGAVVLARNLMTADGSMESNFGEFVTVPADIPSGYYDLVAFDYSPKDGSIENEFPVQIEVTG